MLEKLPGLPISLVGEPSAFSEKAVELDPLFEKERDLDGKAFNSLNRSLFILMKRLNRLEDADLDRSEEYRTRLSDWNGAFDAVEKRFDDSDLSSREKLDSFGILLAALTDSPKRETLPLARVLGKFWQLYRQTLIDEFREMLSVHREAGTPPQRVLEELCEKLESAFRETSESTVRGNTARKAPGETNRKEQLKLDLKKTLVACRNYADRYPVELKIRSAAYDSEQEIDRDYFYRLAFYGGKEKSEVYIDLAISTGVENSTSFAFVPSRKTLTVSLIPEYPLQVFLQQRKKGESAEWADSVVWEFDSNEAEQDALSLALLGVRFYLRYENEENTQYRAEGKGYSFDLDIRRARIVPEFLWEILDTSAE